MRKNYRTLCAACWLALSLMLAGCQSAPKPPVPPPTQAESSVSENQIQGATTQTTAATEQTGNTQAQNTSAPASAQPGSQTGLRPFGRVQAKVVHVIDGDTLKVKFLDKTHRVDRVRLIGIDTPESVAPQERRNVPEGKIASNYTKSRLIGQVVEITFDAEINDHYHRLLGYVYLNEELINRTLLEQGYARLDPVEPNLSYAEEFAAVSKEAEAAGRGFWAGHVFDHFRQLK